MQCKKSLTRIKELRGDVVLSLHVDLNGHTLVADLHSSWCCCDAHAVSVVQWSHLSEEGGSGSEGDDA